MFNATSFRRAGYGMHLATGQAAMPILTHLLLSDGLDPT